MSVRYHFYNGTSMMVHEADWFSSVCYHDHLL
jgi:hypothetical protein